MRSTGHRRAKRRSPGAQAAANPTLGKQRAPPQAGPSLALPGAANHRARGTGEKTEGGRGR